MIYKFILCFALLSSIATAQENKLTSESKVNRVILFVNGGQVERSAQLSIPSGISEVVFKGLSAEIVEQSIQVKGYGDFTILSVNKETDYLQVKQLSDRLTELKNKADALIDSKEIQQNTLSILAKEEEMLGNNQNVGNGGAGLDINRLKLALDFQNARLTENKVKQIAIKKTLQNLDKEIDKINLQLQAETAKPNNKLSNIVVKLKSKSSHQAKFEISYLVKNAGWYPSYDIRAINISKPIELIYRANISQQSGEDWKNVNLILSSGDPSLGGNKPELRPYLLGYNLPRYSSNTIFNSVKGRLTDSKDGQPLIGGSIKIKGSTIGTVSDIDGRYTIQIPSTNSILQYNYIGYESKELPANNEFINVQLNPSNVALQEVMVTSQDMSSALQGKLAGVSIRGRANQVIQERTSAPLEVAVVEKQTNVYFTIAQPYNLLSDGKLLTVEIAQHELNADFSYYVVPKLSPDAYLSATIPGISDLNLLSGEASVFFDGAYLGKTLINSTISTDTLNVSLGADKNVQVTRSVIKEQNGRSTIGSSIKANRAFRFEIFNKKTENVHLIIEDQIPVSNTSEVTVENQELSGAQLNNENGLLKWDFNLKPQEKKSLQLKYQVKYPKNKPIVVE